MEARLKEHQDACRKQQLDKSAVAEHAWHDHCSLKWDEATVVDYAIGSEDLLLKEALDSKFTPMDSLLNRDRGSEIPGCWITAVNPEELNYRTLNFGL